MKTLLATKAIDQSAMGMESYHGSPGYYQGGYMPLYNAQTWTGNATTPDSGLNVSIVYECVRILAETFAAIPLILYRRNGAGKERAFDHPLYAVLHDQPNPDMTSFVWRELVMSHLAMYGNHYSEITYDPFGRLQLWPIRPDRMVAYYDEEGRKSFDYLSPLGGRTKMLPGSVFHIAGMSSNGLSGYSPLLLLAQSLGLVRSAEAFGEAFYRNGARPATVLSHPKNLSTPAIERLAAQMDSMRGAGNAGKTVVLEEGLTVHEVGVPPEAAQYLQSRLFQRRDVAAAYRIPLHKVNDLEHATFSNIEHQSIEFITDTMIPWFTRAEQEIKVQLIAEDDVFAEFLADGYLRGDSVTRAQAFAVRWQHGALSPNEWRGYENMNPLPDGLGDQYFTPVNYASINPPATEAQPVTPTTSRETITAPASAAPPQLVAVKSLPEEFRCPECKAKLAENMVTGMQVRCGKCKVIREVAPLTVA